MYYDISFTCDIIMYVVKNIVVQRFCRNLHKSKHAFSLGNYINLFENLAVWTWLHLSLLTHCFPHYLFCTGHLTKKSDVYSFGVVLLEIMSGKRALDNNRPSGEHNLIEWAKPYLNSKRRVFQVMDARIEGQYTVRQAMKVADLAVRCLSVEPRFRPKMDEIVRVLEELQSSSVDTAGGVGSSRDQNIKRSVHVSRNSNGPRQHRSNRPSVTINNELLVM